MSDEQDDYQPSAGVADAVLPFATALASLALGVVLGGAIIWVAKPADVVEVNVPRDLTAAELEAVCAPSVADKARDLEEAHEKVRNLSTDVASKEAQVAEMEAEMAQRSERGRAMVAELERAKAELAEMTVQLQEAVVEKERLFEELTVTTAKLEETEVALEEQIVKTEHAQEDALTNKWYRFINDSQLEICEKGNRKKLGKCRETVTAKLTADVTRDKFAHCVRSRQATPAVRIIDKGASLPEFAEWIDNEDKITKDWYIDLCDPTLPEAEDGFWEEEHLAPTADDPAPAAVPSDDMDDFDDLPD
jgi:hypothetical protein